MNFMTENGVDVDNVSDSSFFFVAFLHESRRFASYEAKTDDVRLHGAIKFNCVLRVKQKTLGYDASVVDKKIDATANVFDPSATSYVF